MGEINLGTYFEMLAKMWNEQRQCKWSIAGMIGNVSTPTPCACAMVTWPLPRNLTSFPPQLAHRHEPSTSVSMSDRRSVGVVWESPAKMAYLDCGAELGPIMG